VTVLNPRYNENPGKDSVMDSGDMLITMAYQKPDLESLL
jgi:hypothetical protein